jgi:hypothetical protein
VGGVGAADPPPTLATLTGVMVAVVIRRSVAI